MSKLNVKVLRNDLYPDPNGPCANSNQAEAFTAILTSMLSLKNKSVSI